MRVMLLDDKYAVRSLRGDVEYLPGEFYPIDGSTCFMLWWSTDNNLIVSLYEHGEEVWWCNLNGTRIFAITPTGITTLDQREPSHIGMAEFLEGHAEQIAVRQRQRPVHTYVRLVQRDGKLLTLDRDDEKYITDGTLVDEGDSHFRVVDGTFVITVVRQQGKIAGIGVTAVRHARQQMLRDVLEKLR